MLAVGQVVPCSRSFTMLGFVDGLAGTELEQRLGFHAERLSGGFAVAVLTGQRLLPDDIELQGSTRWSGGFRSAAEAECAFLEQVLESRGQNVHQLKQQLCNFFAKGGKRTPAKVIPFVEHSSGMQYPDAQALGVGIRSGVPQFYLKHPRMFSIARVVPPRS